MQKELEVEYKSLLTKEKYEELLVYFNQIALKQPVYEQTNYYFDDEVGTLSRAGITVRLRYKEGAWERTIKLASPSTNDTLYTTSIEQNELITEKEARSCMKHGYSPSKEVRMLLQEHANGPITQLFCMGDLTTKRQDFLFYGDIISLDKNTYNGVVDYELEWETTNHLFVPFTLKQLSVEPKNAKGKRKRFLKTKKTKE